MDQLIMQFMGTGAAEGVPTPFCRCRVCENARKKGGREIRMRSAFRLSKEVMIDFGPDIFSECVRTGTDLYDLKHILITHTHEDHLDIGNLFLKPMVSQKSPDKLHVYFNGDAYELLEALDKMGYDRSEHFFTNELRETFEFHQVQFFKESRIGEYTVTPIKGEHAAHFENNAAGYLIELPDRRKLLYALDTGYYKEETLAYLKDKTIDILILEATFGSRERGDRPYSHLDLHSAVCLCNTLYEQGTLSKASEVYLTHMNQEQDYTHEELEKICQKLQRTLPYKLTPAYDGMKIGGAM